MVSVEPLIVYVPDILAELTMGTFVKLTITLEASANSISQSIVLPENV